MRNGGGGSTTGSPTKRGNRVTGTCRTIGHPGLASGIIPPSVDFASGEDDVFAPTPAGRSGDPARYPWRQGRGGSVVPDPNGVAGRSISTDVKDAQGFETDLVGSRT